MKIAIYQINMERDKNHMAFCSIDNENKIDRSSYDLVFTGDVQDSATLEGIFYIFNIEPPKEYHARSLSVSDIVEFPERGTAHFCQSVGWLEIAPMDAALTDITHNAREDALNAALRDVADKFGMALPELRSKIFYEELWEHDKEDVRTWLNNADARYTDDDVEVIAQRYNDHYDSDYGVWDNIAASAEAVKEHLSDGVRNNIFPRSFDYMEGKE